METFRRSREIHSGVTSKIDRAKSSGAEARIKVLQSRIEQRLNILDLLLFSQLEKHGVLLALDQTDAEEYESVLGLILNETIEPLALSEAESQAISTSLAALIDQHMARQNALPEKNSWGASIRKSATEVNIKIKTLLEEIKALNDEVSDLRDYEQESYLPIKLSRSVRSKIAGIIKRYAAHSTEKGARLSPQRAIEHQVEFAASKRNATNILNSSLARNTQISTATQLFYVLHHLAHVQSLSELELNFNLDFLTDEYEGHFWFSPTEEEEPELPSYRDLDLTEIAAWNEVSESDYPLDQYSDLDKDVVDEPVTEHLISYKSATQNLTPDHWQRAVWMLSCESQLDDPKVIKNITEFFTQYAPTDTLDHWYELLNARGLLHLISPSTFETITSPEGRLSSDQSKFIRLQAHHQKTGRKAAARKAAIKAKRKHEERTRLRREEQQLLREYR